MPSAISPPLVLCWLKVWFLVSLFKFCRENDFERCFLAILSKKFANFCFLKVCLPGDSSVTRFRMVTRDPFKKVVKVTSNVRGSFFESPGGGFCFLRHRSLLNLLTGPMLELSTLDTNGRRCLGCEKVAEGYVQRSASAGFQNTIGSGRKWDPFLKVYIGLEYMDIFLYICYCRDKYHVLLLSKEV